MFEELDDLLAITRTIESSPISHPMMEAKEDLDAVYVDYGDSATPFGTKPTVTKVTSKVTAAKPAPGECAGNPTFKDKNKGPLFEDPEEGGTATVNLSQPISDMVNNGINPLKQAIDDLASEIDEEKKPVTNESLGLGKLSFNECVERGMGRDFMRMYQLECCGQCCPQQNGFRLGDVVHCGNTPALFVVKKADGQMVTAAKPTSNPNELLTSNDGEWPTFTFRASEIQPMLNASIDDVQNIVSFNDKALADRKSVV